MRHVKPKPAVYLASVLMAERPETSPYAAAIAAEKLIRLGKTAARVAVQRCNGIERYDVKARRMLASWTEDDDARADKTVERIEKQATDILATYGATDIQAHGDPRGLVLSWKFESGRSNGWNDGRWGV